MSEVREFEDAPTNVMKNEVLQALTDRAREAPAEPETSVMAGDLVQALADRSRQADDAVDESADTEEVLQQTGKWVCQSEAAPAPAPPEAPAPRRRWPVGVAAAALLSIGVIAAVAHRDIAVSLQSVVARVAASSAAAVSDSAAINPVTTSAIVDNAILDPPTNAALAIAPASSADPVETKTSKRASHHHRK
jgi:hypothetical protein